MTELECVVSFVWLQSNEESEGTPHLSITCWLFRPVAQRHVGTGRRYIGASQERKQSSRRKSYYLVQPKPKK